MATRSRIAIENQDGTVNSIYCHFDGYVSSVGKTLFNHYDQEKLTELIKLGDISVLGESTLDTIAYCRDRGEDLHSIHYLSVEGLFENGFDSGEEYIYCLTKSGIWIMRRIDSPMVDHLAEILEEEGI
jgi:hypothetical protein